MSDFSFNNYELSEFIKNHGQPNSLRNINANSKNDVAPTSPLQLDWKRAGEVLREHTYYRKEKPGKFSGVLLDTKRPTTITPIIPTILVVFNNNMNIFTNDQQICGLDYYQ